MARGQNRRKVDRDPAAERAKLRRALALALPGAAAVAAVALLGWAAWRHRRGGRPAPHPRAPLRGALPRLRRRSCASSRRSGEGDHLLLTDAGAVAASLARHPWIALGRGAPRAPARARDRGDRAARRGARRLRRALPRRRGRPGLQAGHAGRRARPAAHHRASRARTTSERQAEVEPLLAGALALAGPLERSAASTGAPPSRRSTSIPDCGVTLYAGDEGMEVRLGTGEFPAKLERLERVLAALAAEGRQGRGDPPRQPAAPGLGDRAAGGASRSGRRAAGRGEGGRKGPERALRRGVGAMRHSPGGGGHG